MGGLAISDSIYIASPKLLGVCVTLCIASGQHVRIRSNNKKCAGKGRRHCSGIGSFGAFAIFGLFCKYRGKNHNGRGEDYNLKLLDQASSLGGTYRLYLTDCGATCSHGLLLRKEIDTNLGVKLVRREWSVYKQNEAKLTISNNVVKVVNGGITLYGVAR